MVYKQYEDGKYDFNGQEITVKDGMFELDGKKYAGFGYDDGVKEPLSHRFTRGAVDIFTLPYHAVQGALRFATGDMSAKEFFLGLDADYMLGEINPDLVRRIDTPDKPLTAENNNDM